MYLQTNSYFLMNTHQIKHPSAQATVINKFMPDKRVINTVTHSVPAQISDSARSA